MTTPSTETAAGRPNYGRTDIRDLNEALRELHDTEEVNLLHPDNDNPLRASVLVVPSGRRIESIKKYLDEYLERPERRTGTSKAFSLVSFIGLVNRFAAESSAVFADPNLAAKAGARQPTLTAVFDYHPANSADDKDLPADWLRHRALYAPPLSDEWKVWMEKNGQWFGQVEFAHFLEDHATNLIVPNLDDPKLATYASLVQGRFANPTDLIQLSRSLEVSIGTKAKSAAKLQSGEISFLWEETHSDGAGQPLRIADLFQIQIPVFYAGEWYRLAARLRYRLAQGVLTFAYEIVQPDIAFKAAFDEMVEKVTKETSVPVFLGAPEA